MVEPLLDWDAAHRGAAIGELERFVSWAKSVRPGVVPDTALLDRTLRTFALLQPLLTEEVIRLKREIIGVKERRLENLRRLVRSTEERIASASGDALDGLRRELDRLLEEIYILLGRLRQERAELPAPVLTFPAGPIQADREGGIVVTDENADRRLSEHFRLREFLCPRNAPLPARVQVAPRLVELLEAVRARVGAVVTVECTRLIRSEGRTAHDLAEIVRQEAARLRIDVAVAEEGDAARVELR